MTMRRDAVLIVDGRLLQVALVQEATRLGLLPIVTAGHPQAPAFAHAYEHYVLDPYDAAGHAALVETLRAWEPTTGVHLCGVVTAGADVAPTVAHAAARADVAGIPYAVALETHNKRAVRACLDEAGFEEYQPQWCTVDVETLRVRTGAPSTEVWVRDHLTVLGLYQNLALPVVIKPLSQRASRGVSLVRTVESYQPAILKALQYGDSYLIEQCLAGTEHSCEVLFDAQGQPIWKNIVDRPFDYSSGVPIERGHINPTGLCPAAQESIYGMVEAVAHALGVHWGPFKVDVMMVNHRPYVLECTARLSGGFDCQKTSPLTGRHPMRMLLQLACGLPVEAQGVAQGYAACAAVIARRETQIARVPHHTDVIWVIQDGDTIAPPRHCAERLGFAFAHASTYDEAWNKATHLADDMECLLSP